LEIGASGSHGTIHREGVMRSRYLVLTLAVIVLGGTAYASQDPAWFGFDGQAESRPVTSQVTAGTGETLILEIEIAGFLAS
jgi:hypothetical protein